LQYRVLGATGIKVSAICFGVLTIGPLQADLRVEEGAGVIVHALERGINFLDTAESYGTYPYIKEALASQRFKPVITSKSYAYSRQGMKESVERALDEMGLTVIDIFMLHEQENEKTLEGHREALEYLIKAKQQGLIKAIGMSTHSIAGVVAAADHPAIEVIHPLINKGGIGIMDGTATTMGAAIQYARLRGKGLYAMKALGGGNLISQAYSAFQYVRNIPGLASVAVGMKNRDEVDLNITWFEGRRDPLLEARVGRTQRRLHIESWCTGCASCGEVCRYQALSLQDGKTVVDQSKCVLCGYCAAYCPDFCIKVV
jgi:aryl-alcohol dehydrogenase-like predicted oxidoreductase